MSQGHTHTWVRVTHTWVRVKHIHQSSHIKACTMAHTWVRCHAWISQSYTYKCHTRTSARPHIYVGPCHSKYQSWNTNAWVVALKSIRVLAHTFMICGMEIYPSHGTQITWVMALKFIRVMAQNAWVVALTYIRVMAYKYMSHGPDMCQSYGSEIHKPWHWSLLEIWHDLIAWVVAQKYMSHFTDVMSQTHINHGTEMNLAWHNNKSVIAWKYENIEM